MLTIKVIRPDKSEYIEEISSVFYNTAEQSFTRSPSITYFTIQREGRVGVQNTIDVYEGLVYVMNDNGKTVANYCLSGIPEVPKE